MSLPSTMSGVQLTGHGGPEKLVWSDALSVPSPRKGWALVKVLAAGVNNTDINTRIGWYARENTGSTQDTDGASSDVQGGWSGALPFPLIQGGDLCGEVVALGPDTTGPAIGARVVCANVQPDPDSDSPVGYRVIGSEYDGAFAQYCAVPADALYDVTRSPLSDVEIGAMPCAFGTAMGLVHRSGVAANSRVLVTGASGGVGMAATSIASHLGAQVTGICHAEKAAFVKEAGATHTLARNAQPPAQSYDIVIDLVGGPAFPALLDALRPGGRYAVSGAIAGPIVEADLRTIYLNDLTLIGCTFQSPESFAALIALINDGAIRPRIAQTFPLKDIAQAQAAFAEKSYAGKLVLIP